MPLVRDVIDDLLWMAVEFAKAADIPVYPAGLIVAFEFGQLVIRLATFLIVPEPQASGAFDQFLDR